MRGEAVGKGEDIKQVRRDIEAKKEERPLPAGWEYIWLQNPWTHQPKCLIVPGEEAEWRQREVKAIKPSYWGGKEAWVGNIREEKAKIV